METNGKTEKKGSYSKWKLVGRGQPLSPAMKETERTEAIHIFNSPFFVNPTLLLFPNVVLGRLDPVDLRWSIHAQLSWSRFTTERYIDHPWQGYLVHADKHKHIKGNLTATPGHVEHELQNIQKLLASPLTQPPGLQVIPWNMQSGDICSSTHPWHNPKSWFSQAVALWVRWLKGCLKT